ncbi:MAG TPA: hypothetical protein VJJ23_00725 [Candidatus Nanoarchaeia archaeon]|nr:hypothetical protein [Candidatus Nanoarchaeia archaeon]
MTSKKEVLEEIEQFKAKWLSEKIKTWGESRAKEMFSLYLWKIEYYNKFYTILPGGILRGIDPKYLDKKIEDSRAGELLRSQSKREFYQTIDRVIQELGYNLSYIEQLNQPFRGIYKQPFIFPVYLRLREIGYKRYPDLVA